MRPLQVRGVWLKFTGQGDHPADGDTQVIRLTTTQPVGSIKGQRPRTAALTS
jgi:hypothetical protein